MITPQRNSPVITADSRTTKGSPTTVMTLSFMSISLLISFAPVLSEQTANAVKQFIAVFRLIFGIIINHSHLTSAVTVLNGKDLSPAVGKGIVLSGIETVSVPAVMILHLRKISGAPLCKESLVHNVPKLFCLLFRKIIAHIRGNLIITAPFFI